MNTSIPSRREMERNIVHRLVTDLLGAGLSLTVDNTTDEDGPRYITSNDAAVILPNLGHVEEETIRAYDQGRYVGSWLLVYGNDGYDVICDYTDTDEVQSLMRNVDLLSEEYQERLFGADHD